MAVLSGDPRVHDYARLIVERSLGVQPGWQVLVRTTPVARPLVTELVRLVAQRGAYPILRIGPASLWPVDSTWAAVAPDELVGQLASEALIRCPAPSSLCRPNSRRADG